jgi:hypothetical protein
LRNNGWLVDPLPPNSAFSVPSGVVPSGVNLAEDVEGKVWVFVRVEGVVRIVGPVFLDRSDCASLLSDVVVNGSLVCLYVLCPVSLEIEELDVVGASSPPSELVVVLSIF